MTRCLLFFIVYNLMASLNSFKLDTFHACRLRSNVQSSDQALSQLSAAFVPSPITWFSCAVLKEPSLLFGFKPRILSKLCLLTDPILGHFSVSLTIFFCQAPSAVDKIVPLVDTLLMALQVILFTRWVKHAASLHRTLVTLEM